MTSGPEGAASKQKITSTKSRQDIATRRQIQKWFGANDTASSGGAEGVAKRVSNVPVDHGKTAEFTSRSSSKLDPAAPSFQPGQPTQPTQHILNQMSEGDQWFDEANNTVIVKTARKKTKMGDKDWEEVRKKMEKKKKKDRGAGFGYHAFNDYDEPELFLGDPRDRAVAEDMGMDPWSLLGRGIDHI